MRLQLPSDEFIALQNAKGRYRPPSRGTQRSRSHDVASVLALHKEKKELL